MADSAIYPYPLSPRVRIIASIEGDSDTSSFVDVKSGVASLTHEGVGKKRPVGEAAYKHTAFPNVVQSPPQPYVPRFTHQRVWEKNPADERMSEPECMKAPDNNHSDYPSYNPHFIYPSNLYHETRLIDSPHSSVSPGKKEQDPWAARDQSDTMSEGVQKVRAGKKATSSSGWGGRGPRALSQHSSASSSDAWGDYIPSRMQQATFVSARAQEITASPTAYPTGCRADVGWDLECGNVVRPGFETCAFHTQYPIPAYRYPSVEDAPDVGVGSPPTYVYPGTYHADHRSPASHVVPAHHLNDVGSSRFEAVWGKPKQEQAPMTHAPYSTSVPHATSKSGHNIQPCGYPHDPASSVTSSILHPGPVVQDTRSTADPNQTELDLLLRCVASNSTSQEDRCGALRTIGNMNMPGRNKMTGGAESGAYPTAQIPAPGSMLGHGCDTFNSTILYDISKNVTKTHALLKFQEQQKTADRLARIEAKLAERDHDRSMPPRADSSYDMEQLKHRLKQLEEGANASTTSRPQEPTTDVLDKLAATQESQGFMMEDMQYQLDRVTDQMNEHDLTAMPKSTSTPVPPQFDCWSLPTKVVEETGNTPGPSSACSGWGGKARYENV